MVKGSGLERLLPCLHRCNTIIHREKINMQKGKKKRGSDAIIFFTQKFKTTHTKQVLPWLQRCNTIIHRKTQKKEHCKKQSTSKREKTNKVMHIQKQVLPGLHRCNTIIHRKTEDKKISNIYNKVAKTE